ncbi:uncharacterized protein Dwil_GK20062 [Drosophila willistoni]|uniref:Chitin-binding type-2 domain-containing protein n=1 Tax=Drosophila willistoni TaxID=7260 RepID=B4MSZ7_DROWI|nr:serine-rich adhesin for platelets [Drosophila willistoni]EDW75236.1 uncharacterized protein Dwil_GK20062 [Drosophila willistoni]
MISFLKLPLGIAICLLVVHIEKIHANTDNPCTGAGFFALVDNTSEFYACDEMPTGGYSVRYLQCQTGLVFSAQLGKCVEQLPLPAEEIISPEERDDGNIENPTIPPTNLDESTSTVESTESSTTKAAESSTTENTESSSTTAVTDDGTSSTKDGESSSTSAVTEDDDTSSTKNGESSSTSAVTEDDDTSSTKNGESSSTSAVTKDDDSSSSSVVTDAPDSSSTASDAVTKTTEQSDDDICATNGFLPKSGNCSQYVYCQDKGDYLKPYNFDCPQGMQFNPACNYCIKGYDCTKA